MKLWSVHVKMDGTGEPVPSNEVSQVQKVKGPSFPSYVEVRTIS
jgi:hypothetical protein